MNNNSKTKIEFTIPTDPIFGLLELQLQILNYVHEMKKFYEQRQTSNLSPEDQNLNELYKVTYSLYTRWQNALFGVFSYSIENPQDSSIVLKYDNHIDEIMKLLIKKVETKLHQKIKQDLKEELEKILQGL